MSLEVVFLGTGGCIRVPTFNCTCSICEEARRENTTRTRASIALIGEETTIIDASPDLSAQLERESIRKIDNIFLTHWHFDHVWGLAEIVEPTFMSDWKPVKVYLPEKAIPLYKPAMGYLNHEVDIHTVIPGDVIETADAEYLVVKTNHTAASVGYVIKAGKRLAYLLDTFTPSQETREAVNDVDILVLDALVDKMTYMENRWLHFSVDEAVDFWRTTCVESCILSHLTCHSLIDGKIVAGYSAKERENYENQYKGLTFAYDGLRIKI
jgi:phosphoribosyl 1,2-cyclic phosphate phosphodiesterase